ncbi:M23 family metallopeptidase [Brevibacillus daliensis]|uniref:M23 family metallopeptidase n=1 Tax=Brevibacillus daliensis TaxID=2892995 RepID=UPI001E60FEC7|nr:M23 family metallopeptidase [Brevibacillus daliensis]
MDANHPTLINEWDNKEEAKQAVVEQALFEVFNPFSSLEKNEQLAKKHRSIASYTVQKGDTLSTISDQYGVSLKEIVQDNQIQNPNMVGIGLKLVINRKEITHSVEQGETIESIAKRYNLTAEEIINKNPLLQVMPDCLYNGQLLVIPVEASPAALPGNVEMRRQMTQLASRNSSARQAMSWPVDSATVTSEFGSRWGNLHKGLDMWNESRGNTPIMAAQHGVVVEAGAKRSGYGKMVVLDHGGGLQTFYAHMRKITVSEGQEIEQGEMLGFMGKTGDSTDYHLHFEVRLNDNPINPLRYLRR